MELIQAILMGIVQGLSEFLPISSSAHLVFASSAYKMIVGSELVINSNQEIFLDIMLHLGTLIAVLIFFKEDVIRILKALYSGLKNKDYQDADFKMGIYIVLGTVLTIAVALPLSDITEKLVFMPSVVGLLLIFTGFLLLFSEYYSKKYIQNKEMSIKKSMLIGIAQGLASFPGLSRSGLTIATGMLTGLERMKAARYSFLLSIPIILGASMVYPLVKIDFAEVVHYNWTAIIIGTIVSGIVGYFCIKYFLKFIEKFSLSVFGWYCLLIGVLAAILFSRGV